MFRPKHCDVFYNKYRRFSAKKGIFRSGKTAETAKTAYTADLGTTNSLPISVF